jgi:phosphoglycerate kinase
VKYIDQMDLKGKRVFLRADFNVPLDKEGNIADDNRIRSVLPTITYALNQDAAVILASHLGRPKGKRAPQYTLKPVALRLSQLLRKDVTLVEDCVGPIAEQATADMKPGDILLLENLRFHAEEEEDDRDFAQKLAALADVYVNDAFAVSHRANASVAAIAEFFKEKAAGFLLKSEIEYFNRAMKNPKRPLVAILGGVKVSDKLGLLRNLLANVDKMIIGGAMANTFLKALYGEVGISMVESEFLSEARAVMEEARRRGVKLYVPVDCVVAKSMDSQAERRITPAQEVFPGWMILDVGPATSTLYGEVVEGTGTIIWNGPMGAFEIEPFSHGTYALVSKVAASGALTIIGGGDTGLAVQRAGEAERMSYISTGGGAFLELLEGKTLPGVAALE